MADIDLGGAVIPPPSPHEFHEREGRRWPVLLLYALAAVVISVAVVFLGRWVYRSSVHNTTKHTTTGQVQQPNNRQPSKSTGTNNQAGRSSSSSPNNLPNNGPGNVLAIFTATAAVTGGVHYVLKRHLRDS